ncbi:globin domain-containing protein [Catenuloplanes atrovinosus]|uniref:Hemoglobin-like flavoprotein n=1 Tax=Catenuloplanes atrovinosus TaxID=137266 RepID=A0AAE3YPF1_9ACTN|nr:globin domain-containing protein [Catenuloplanes atrovinosus]MDR7276136.1 hemoglobin-like flavoprotein [Catenuloplanes atrovinosus]
MIDFGAASGDLGRTTGAVYSAGTTHGPSGSLGDNRRPTAEAMQIVQRTAEKVADRPVALAEAFYRHLFALAPGVRSMFPEDMTAQNERLCRALLDGIRALVEPERYAGQMERALHRLGAHHADRLGVRPEHYPYVGHALVRAVGDISDDWSSSTSSAWIWVYDWMAAHMLSAAGRPGHLRS